MQYTIKLPNLHATKEFAKLISCSISPNFVITLKGDLGAGKTTLVREILYQLGVVGSVKSPTYNLVEPYIVNDIQINHFDLYRFNDPDEWIESGFDEYFSSNCICFIEWPEKADSYLPQVDWKLQITVDDDNRSIEINPQSNKGRECLIQLIKIAAH